MKARVRWTEAEDDDIRIAWESANGAFVPRRMQAEMLNARYHGGESVRSESSIRRRERVVLFGAKDAAKAAKAGEEPIK